MGRKSEEKAVLDEYKSIFSRRVDIVGDYAGSEIFLVEFDSLLLQCFSNSKLNFDSKFWKLPLLRSGQSIYILPRRLSAASRGLHR
jgi:hypothetical protein